jgi:hypothetical protein
MSVGSNLQEMENVVTKGAAAAEPMPQSGSNASGVSTPGQTGEWEDLGGPTPENYKSDDDSAKVNEPKIASVKDIVNRGAKPAEPMPSMPNPVKEEEELEGEVVSEQEEDYEDFDSSEEELSEDDEETTVIEYDIEEDVNALLQDEELSEEFQEKARTIFETAINAKVSEIQEELVQQYEKYLEEEVVTIKEELTSRVDSYLEYVADEWMNQNQLVVEQGLKTEMTESFLMGMKNLFEEHYVTIPEEKYDVLHTMVEKLDEMEDKLNEQIEKNIALNQRLAESVADVIFSDVCEGLALSQKEKLASLAENVEFDSEQNYREKLTTLRESYFPTNVSAQRSETENLSEEVSYEEQINESISPMMQSYLDTLSRASKN